MKQKFLSGLLLVFTLAGTALPSFAHDGYYRGCRGGYYNRGYARDYHAYMPGVHDYHAYMPGVYDYHAASALGRGYGRGYGYGRPYNAYARYDRPGYAGYGYHRAAYDQYMRGQYVQKAAVGGLAGAAIGGIMNRGGDVGGGAVRGGLIGAGAGLGYQYLRNHGIF